MLKAVIFDMDGVIVDSEPMHFEVDRRVLERCDFVAGDEVLSKYVAVPNPIMWKALKEEFDLKMSVEELLELQTQLKVEVMKETCFEAIDGIMDLISYLKKNNIKMAIASSSPRFFIEYVVKSLSIHDCFDVIISGDEVKKGKPNPDIFLKASEMLEVKTSECVVIEDSANGVSASVSAGIKCIGYKNPNSGNQDLSNAFIIVDSIRKISFDFMG